MLLSNQTSLIVKLAEMALRRQVGRVCSPPATNFLLLPGLKKEEREGMEEEMWR